MEQRKRAKRITLKTLITYAQTLGQESLAYRALRQFRELERDGIRADIKMVPTGFLLFTVCHTYKFA